MRSGSPARQLRAALNLTAAPPPTPHITVAGGGQVNMHGAVTADLSQRGRCHDTTAISGAELDSTVQRSGRLHIALVPITGTADPLRTHCPSPDLDRHGLATATATAPRPVWRQRTFRVRLTLQ